MSKKITSLILIVLMSMATFSGCKKDMPAISSDLTIKDLKKAYNVSAVQEENQMSPFWNVDQNTQFTFHFNSKVEPALAITVHTDPKCETNSRVGQLNAAYKCDNGIDVVVKPGLAVLSETSNQTEAAWGNAPIYYLSINYDRFSNEVKKLDTPVVVPFTVKTDVSTPTLTGKINNMGQFQLDWTPVDGAVSYELYESSVGLREETNEKIDGYTRSELGYVGDHLTKIADVTDTTYTDFKYDVSDNNVYTDPNGNIAIQNTFLPLTYFVRAKDEEGHVGNFSMAVESWKFANKMPSSVELYELNELPETVPVKMKDNSTANMPINFTKLEDDTNRVKYKYEIPGTMLTGFVYLIKTEGVDCPDEKKSSISMNYGMYEVKNSESIIPAVTAEALSAAQKEIITVDEERQISTYSPDMRMAVAEMENVRLLNKGIYSKTMEDLINEYGSFYGTSTTSTTETPTEEPTVENPTEEPVVETPAEEPVVETPTEEPAPEEPVVETPTEEPTPEEPVVEPPVEEPAPEEPVVEQPPEEPTEEPSPNLDPDVNEANNDPVPNTGYRMFADNAEEEYLARMMIAGMTEIDLTAFPRLQDTTYLVDVLQKVVFQNPYVISVNAYSYDPASKTLSIKYDFDSNAIAKRQKEINAEVTTILSDAVTEGMTDEEKALSIWNKLEDDTVYDDEACEAAEKSGFTDVGPYADAFNAYGIICKKKGVCQSYAYAYKLLLVESGVDAKVLTGFLNRTLPHAWNIVNLGGNWYWFDLTNNAKNAGIPYMLYEASSTYAEEQDYVLDESYDLDTNLSWVANSDDSKNYYNQNSLVAESLIDAPDKIVSARKFKRHGAYAVYVKSGVEQEQITSEFLTKLAEKLVADGMKPDDLEKIKIGCGHNFIFLLEE